MSAEYRIIYLTKGFECRVSPEDFDLYGHLLWHINCVETSPYAARTRVWKGKSTKIYLHRLIMGCPPGMVVNHKDGDTMNCVRDNLEVVHPRANSTTKRVNKGRYGYIGVGLRSDRQQAVGGRKDFRARITVQDERVMLGYFYTAEEAARAYDVASVDAFSVYADTNFPITDYLCPWQPTVPGTPKDRALLEDIPF